MDLIYKPNETLEWKGECEFCGATFTDTFAGVKRYGVIRKCPICRAFEGVVFKQTLNILYG